MDYTQWFADRLAQLRMQKHVSARDMSLSLGQSESYINKIENRRTMPSMNGFFYICEYLNVTPAEFFDAAHAAPRKTAEIAHAARRLRPTQAEHVLQIIQDLSEMEV